MLVYKYYKREEYPLAYFNYNTIPAYMLELIEQLNNKFDLLVRGGLSYILLTDDYSYQLKDIDLALKAEETNNIYKEIKNMSEEIYYNKNVFGDDALTLFWGNRGNYYKIDILLLSNFPNNTLVDFDLINNHIKVMNAAELWFNRISKVAEKRRRKHSDSKTLNHYKIVIKLSDFLLRKHKIDKDLFKTLLYKQVSRKLMDSIIVLKELLNEDEIKSYKCVTQKVIEEVWGGY